MESESNQMVEEGQSKKLLKDFLIRKDIKRLQDSYEYNQWLEVSYRSALEYLVKSTDEINNYSSDCGPRVLQEDAPLDLRTRRDLRLASFASNLASEPNVNSKEYQKEMRQQRLQEASQRLKDAKRLWKAK